MVKIFLLKCPINLSSYLDITTSICIKPASIDKFVSFNIRENGAWEPNFVNSVLKIVQRFPEATFLGFYPEFYRFPQYWPIFLDIGSNIGMFALSVAAMNRSVVAVDALPVNLAYIRESISLGGFSQNVRTINNAVGWVETSSILVQCWCILIWQIKILEN